jgi:hypothetical protein
MRLRPKLKGRPSKKDQRDLREQADQLILDATLPSDGYIISAIYQAITTDKFPALTRSMVAAGKKLAREEEMRLTKG